MCLKGDSSFILSEYPSEKFRRNGMFFRVLSVFGSIMLLISSNALAYEMPIGIPAFDWGGSGPIDTVSPSVPSPWSSEETNYYYVDPSHSNSTDSGNVYGYPAKPRDTLPSTVEAGSVVIVAGTISSSLTINNYNCTESQPCWVRGLSEAEAPTLTSRLYIRDSSYVFVENLDFNGGTGGAIFMSGMDTHHISIRNNQIRNREWNGNTAGISTVPSLGGAIHDVVIYNNELHDLGDYTLQYDQDFQGFNPSMWDRDSTTDQYNMWFLENTCYRISGDCVQVNAGPWSGSENYLHHIYIGKNTASQNRQGGFWVKQARDVIISQNLAYDMNGGGSGNAGHGIGGQYPKNNVWYIFNEVRDSVFGFRQSDTSSPTGDIYIIGNLFHDIRPTPGRTDYDPDNAWEQGTAIALWHGNSQRYIVDNTIHNTYDGINAIYDGYVEIFGNIISQIDNATDNHFFSLEHPAKNDNVEINYNLFIDEGAESYYSWWNNSGFDSSLAEIQAASGGRCSDCVAISGSDSSDVFVVPGSSFTLKTTSKAVGANVKHPVYDKFKQLYGLDIYVDFNGNPRSSTDPSIGAFELHYGNYPPSPPTLLE
jgi:hypothetical protein